MNSRGGAEAQSIPRQVGRDCQAHREFRSDQMRPPQTRSACQSARHTNRRDSEKTSANIREHPCDPRLNRFDSAGCSRADSVRTRWPTKPIHSFAFFLVGFLIAYLTAVPNSEIPWIKSPGAILRKRVRRWLLPPPYPLTDRLKVSG